MQSRMLTYSDVHMLIKLSDKNPLDGWIHEVSEVNPVSIAPPSGSMLELYTVTPYRVWNYLAGGNLAEIINTRNNRKSSYLDLKRTKF